MGVWMNQDWNLFHQCHRTSQLLLQNIRLLRIQYRKPGLWTSSFFLASVKKLYVNIFFRIQM
jgi:hypothetical protein